MEVHIDFKYLNSYFYRSSRVRFPAEAGNFSPHHSVQSGSGAHPASYPMGIRGCFHGGKAAGEWSWPPNPISCRGQRVSGAISPLPNTPSWRGAQLKNRDNFIFTILLMSNDNTVMGNYYKKGSGNMRSSYPKSKHNKDLQTITSTM